MMRKSSNASPPTPFGDILHGLVSAFFGRACSCARMERIVSLWADSQATDAEKREIDAHCAECINCRVLRATMLAARAELRERPFATIPDGLADRLQAAMRDERVRERSIYTRRARIFGPQLRLGLGGALATVLAAAVFIAHDELHHKPVVAPSNSSHPMVAVLTPRDVQSVPKISTSPARTIVASVPHTNVDPVLPPAIQKPHQAATLFTRPVESVRRSPAQVEVVATNIKPVDHFPSSGPVKSPKVEQPVLVAKAPVHQPESPDVSTSPILTAPEPVQVERPTEVAVLPPSERSGGADTAVAVVASDDHGTHLNGLLRGLVHRADTRQVADAKISLASMVLKPAYSETVPMVSAPVH